MYLWGHSRVCFHLHMSVGMCEFAGERWEGHRILPLSSPGYWLSQSVSWNLHLAGWATLDHQFSLGMPCLSIPGLHITLKWASGHTLAFTWVLGIRTLVQMLAQHSFCPLSHLFGSPQMLFWRTYFVQGICLGHTYKQTTNPQLMKFIPAGSLDNKNLAWATTEEKMHCRSKSIWGECEAGVTSQDFTLN